MKDSHVINGWKYDNNVLSASCNNEDVDIFHVHEMRSVEDADESFNKYNGVTISQGR